MSDETRDWRMTVLLCDSAQVAEGKLYVLGGGWSVCGPGPFVHGLALKLDVPWNEANRRHKAVATLHDEDSRPVAIGEPPREVRFESAFEVGRPPGHPPGTPLDLPLAINMGPLELPPGRGYFWSIRIEDTEIGRASFRVRPAASG